MSINLIIPPKKKQLIYWAPKREGKTKTAFIQHHGVNRGGQND